MGANLEQSQSTVPFQCAPCEAAWLWVWTSIAAGTSAVVVEANEQSPTSVAAEPAAIAIERGNFFIFRYPNPCRAQLLNLFSSINEETPTEVALSIEKFHWHFRPTSER